VKVVSKQFLSPIYIGLLGVIEEVLPALQSSVVTQAQLSSGGSTGKIAKNLVPEVAFSFDDNPMYCKSFCQQCAYAIILPTQ